MVGWGRIGPGPAHESRDISRSGSIIVVIALVRFADRIEVGRHEGHPQGEETPGR
jgi:hypothetical protein